MQDTSKEPGRFFGVAAASGDVSRSDDDYFPSCELILRLVAQRRIPSVNNAKADGSGIGAILTENSERTKFPLSGCRPGPLNGKLGSVSASSRIPVIPAKVVGAVIVKTSVFSSGPLTMIEWSGKSVKISPLEVESDDGSSTVQFAVTSPPVGRPSQNVLRSSVVTDRRKWPSICAGASLFFGQCRGLRCLVVLGCFLAPV